jgi:hypothetical protein
MRRFRHQSDPSSALTTQVSRGALSHPTLAQRELPHTEAGKGLPRTFAEQFFKKGPRKQVDEEQEPTSADLIAQIAEAEGYVEELKSRLAETLEAEKEREEEEAKLESKKLTLAAKKLALKKAQEELEAAGKDVEEAGAS